MNKTYFRVYDEIFKHNLKSRDIAEQEKLEAVKKARKTKKRASFGKSA